MKDTLDTIAAAVRTAIDGIAEIKSLFLSKISSLQATIDAQAATIAALQSDNAAYTEQVNALKTQVAMATAALDDLKSAVDAGSAASSSTQPQGE